MVMAFNGDAPVQCKFGGLKDGGYRRCRRHQISMVLKRDASRSKLNLLYCSTCREARHPPVTWSCKNIQIAASHW